MRSRIQMLKRWPDSKPLTVVVALVVIGLVGLADHLAYTEIILPIFYLLPVLLVAWYVNLPAAILMACLGVALSLSDDLVRSRFPSPVIPYWNAGAELAVDIVAAVAVRRLREVNDRLRASEALREDLTNMLVHDLKNPLVAASMALQLYRRRRQAENAATPQVQQEQEQLLDIAAESNEHLRRLIEDILDVARAEAGKMPLALELVDLAGVVHAAVQAAASPLERGDRELAEFYPEEPLPTEIDPTKITRVVENLLDNALKYSPSQGHLQVRVETRDGEALVSVHDEGPGIPPEMHQRIFERFGQAEAVHEGRRMSFGLGLAFAKLAVEAHGGRIWVESAPGQGSTFTFALPLTNQRAV